MTKCFIGTHNFRQFWAVRHVSWMALMRNMEITIKGLTNLNGFMTNHGFMTDQWLHGPSNGFMTDHGFMTDLIITVV